MKRPQNGKVLAQPVRKEFVTEAPAQLIVIEQKDEVIANPGAAGIATRQDLAVVEIPANSVGGGAKVSIQAVSVAK